MLSGDLGFLSAPFDSYLSFDGDLLDYVHEFCKEYISLVKSLDKDSTDSLNRQMTQLVNLVQQKEDPVVFDLLKDIETISAMVEEVIVQYYKGFPMLATEELEKTLSANDMHYFKLLPQFSLHRSPTFYRMREKRCHTPLEFFHVPYEKRHLASYSRYSIAGYPSLYLAHSLKTAWQEMGCPAPTQVSYAKYEAKNDKITFIDMGLPLHGGTHFTEIYSLLVFYPLIMSCSLKVKPAHTGTYIPEYIIPQRLLEVFRLHKPDDIVGISYPSSKAGSIDDFVSLKNRNFVIPIRGAEQREGYSSEVADLFRMSGPVMYPDGYGNIEALQALSDNAQYYDINTRQTISQ